MRSNVGAGLLAKAATQSALMSPDTAFFASKRAPTSLPGIILSRLVGARLLAKKAVSGDINADCVAAFASKPAPTFDRIPKWERACSRRGHQRHRILKRTT